MRRKRANRSMLLKTITRHSWGRAVNQGQAFNRLQLRPVVQLQQNIGNQAMGWMIQAQSLENQPGDPVELQTSQLSEDALRMLYDGIHRVSQIPLPVIDNTLLSNTIKSKEPSCLENKNKVIYLESAMV